MLLLSGNEYILIQMNICKHIPIGLGWEDFLKYLSQP